MEQPSINSVPLTKTMPSMPSLPVSAALSDPVMAVLVTSIGTCAHGAQCLSDKEKNNLILLFFFGLPFSGGGVNARATFGRRPGCNGVGSAK